MHGQTNIMESYPTTIRQPRFIWKPKSMMGNYIVALIIGLMAGLKVIPVPVVASLYLLLSAVCIFKCFQGDVMGFFTIVPFVMYTEILIRGFARWVPYLTLQYLFIICFTLLMMVGIKQKVNHFKGFFLLLLYMVLELLNNLAPDKAEIGRSIMTNSLALLLPVIWASYNVLNPILINKLLTNIKIATIMLAGIVLAAHITGKINYGLYSNSESSNGLAPVQLSGYLGLGCILFFLSIMNEEEKKNRRFNIIVLSLAATVMVLTFSRGGLYFLFGVACIYFFYNRHRMGKYIQMLVLIPISFIIYLFVVNQTQGKIVERYEQEGTSNRDVLASIGFELFLRNPIIGVGTGNYNTTIKKEKLFDQESGAHNEFVRAAAEHGIIGIFFYWGFFLFLFVDVMQRRQPEQQYAMYFLVLFCFIIVHNGLKISIQPILLMLAVGTPTVPYRKQKNVYNQTYNNRRVARYS